MLLLDGGNHIQCPNTPCAKGVRQAVPGQADLPHLSDVIDEKLGRN